MENLNEQSFTKIYYPSKEYTIKEWVDKIGEGVPNDKKLTPTDFLSLKFKDSRTNFDSIWSQYDVELRKKYEQDYKNRSLPDSAPVLAGTPTVVLLSKMELEIVKLSKQGQFMSQSDFNAFWSDSYKKILNSISYKPEYSETSENASFDVRIVPQSIRVWVYVNSLGKIIDLSNFIISCNTEKIATGGGFSIRISPVLNQKSLLDSAKDFVEIYNLTDEKGNLAKSFWEKYLSQNDLIFIRFEKLQIEKDSVGTDSSDLEVSKNNLVNNKSNYNVWDMIGLLDICTVSYSAGESSYFVDLIGRDFSKLFTDDGSYFMPLKWVEGSKDRWFYGGDEQDSWFKRNVVSGNYNYFFTYGFRGIRETIWFIINILSNIGIVPDSLFDSYKERRVSSYKIETGGVPFQSQKVKGIWQILKVFVDKNLEDRTVVDASFANPDGTLMSFISKICQPPFVEVLFDTYVDTLDIVVRQPPFTEKAIKDVVDNKSYIEVDSNNLVNLSLGYDDRVYSWYQLFPQNNFTGTRLFTSLAFVPIIYFEEFTKIWGNKKQQIQDIYISLSSLDGVSSKQEMNSFSAAILNDLLFVIETSVYLPFTRKGEIVLKGDRRIKVGTFIKLNATNELFYVTGVSQSITFSRNQIERITRVRVERGMLLPILTGKKEAGINIVTSNGEKASYFKIAKLNKIKEDIRKAEKVAKSDRETSGSGKYAIDKNQFDFFFKRKMYK